MGLDRNTAYGEEGFSDNQEQESQPADSLLAVSELEEKHWNAILDLRVTSQRDMQAIQANTSSILMLNDRLRDLEERVSKSEEYAKRLSEVCVRHRLEIESLKVHKAELEERFRGLTHVVNSVVERLDRIGQMLEKEKEKD